MADLVAYLHGGGPPPDVPEGAMHEKGKHSEDEEHSEGETYEHAGGEIHEHSGQETHEAGKSDGDEQ